MTKVYKYRANLIVDGQKRDTIQLSENKLHAANFRILNDPFEGSVDLPKSERYDSWVTPLKQGIYDVGVYSLSKPKDGESFPCNELLWAHYANSHKGFCIEYDLELLGGTLCRNFDISNRINVDYKDQRPEVLETDNIFDVQTKVFGTKSLAWEYENEVRLVFSKEGLKPIAKEAVTAIYFGLNISLEDRRDIVNRMSGRNIDFYQVERVENLYELKATKLEFDYLHDIVDVEPMKYIDNYIILYKSINKDKNTIYEFVEQFRTKLTRPANITIIDNLKIKDLINKPRFQLSEEEVNLEAKHWIALSTFDAPATVWMYPEK